MLSTLFFVGCGTYNIKREFNADKISSVVCVKKSMREVIPDIAFTDYGRNDGNFTARWHIRNTTEVQVNVKAKNSPAQVTIEGKGDYSNLFWGFENPIYSEEYLTQMENRIKENCKN